MQAEKEKVFTNKEAVEMIMEISSDFDISTETVEYVYDRLSEYPCFDRENGIMCLGIACELIKDNINHVNRLISSGKLDTSDVPEFMRQPQFTTERAYKKSLLLTYNYEAEPNAAVVYGLKK